MTCSVQFSKVPSWALVCAVGAWHLSSLCFIFVSQGPQGEPGPPGQQGTPGTQVKTVIEGT